MHAFLIIALAVTPASEVERVREHLRGAEALLSERDVSTLTTAQRHNRELNAGRLHAYLTAGRFPKNVDFPGRRLPLFRDAEGTLCAVGFLLWESGEHALVNRIAATRNTATIAELADEPGLAAWLDAQGLTLREAARIQPGYDFLNIDIPTPAYAVQAGECSPRIDIVLQQSGTDRFWVSVATNSNTVGIYEDAACSVPLHEETTPRSAGFEIRASRPGIHFKEPTEGMLKLTFSTLGNQMTQTHQVGPTRVEPLDDDLGPAGARGCTTTGFLPLAALALALVRRRRAQR